MALRLVEIINKSEQQHLLLEADIAFGPNVSNTIGVSGQAIAECCDETFRSGQTQAGSKCQMRH